MAPTTEFAATAAGKDHLKEFRRFLSYNEFEKAAHELGAYAKKHAATDDGPQVISDSLAELGLKNAPGASHATAIAARLVANAAKAASPLEEQAVEAWYKAYRKLESDDPSAASREIADALKGHHINQTYLQICAHGAVREETFPTIRGRYVMKQCGLTPKQEPA